MDGTRSSRWVVAMARLGVWPGTLLVSGISLLAAVGITLAAHLVLDVPLYPSLWLAVVCPLLIATPIGFVLMRLIDDLKGAERRLRALSFTDDLTGLPNRRCFFQVASRVLSQARRYREPLALAAVDIDHFKAVNDEFGHGSGDYALQLFARTCKEALREADQVYRLGGEEFAVLMPCTSEEAARQAIERLRAVVEATPIPCAGRFIRTTISAGIVSDSGREEEDIGRLLSRADAALYLAKNGGRNRVEVAF